MISFLVTTLQVYGLHALSPLRAAPFLSANPLRKPWAHVFLPSFNPDLIHFPNSSMLRTTQHSLAMGNHHHYHIQAYIFIPILLLSLFCVSSALSESINASSASNTGKHLGGNGNSIGEKGTPEYLQLFVEETNWYNSLVLGPLLPRRIWSPLPKILQTWLRNYIAGIIVYFVSGGLWCFYIYYLKRHIYFPKGLAFNPLDGILQAVPHVIALFLIPTHFFTHELLLFCEGVWTTNIHDSIHGEVWPVMGAGYHTIHHTTYRHNYGHYTIWMDWMFGTLRDPTFEAKNLKDK